MFSWIGKDERRKKEPEVYATVGDGLKRLYKQKLYPLEEHYKFHDFHSPPLDDPDFEAKPMVSHFIARNNFLWTELKLSI